MSNFGIKIDLLKLKGAFLKNIKGKNNYKAVSDYPRGRLRRHVSRRKGLLPQSQRD